MSENSDNADLRDRAFIYWRLLTADLEVAKKIIFGEKPATIIKKEQQIPFKLVDKLIPQLGYVTSVLHQDEFTLELDSEPLYLLSLLLALRKKYLEMQNFLEKFKRIMSPLKNNQLLLI